MEPLVVPAPNRPRALALLAGYALVVGAVSLAINVGAAAGGAGPAVCRGLIGLLGLAGGALILAGGRFAPARAAGLGWLLLCAWAALQIPVVAWDTGGNAFGQVIALPLGLTTQTTINGRVAAFSEFGVNLVGIVLLVLVLKQREEVQQRVAAEA